GRNGIMMIYVFTMYFSGGLIPTYLMVKELGLINQPAVIVILSAFSVYNMIIAKTYFTNAIPMELQEAAYVDGCTTQRLFFSIILPLAKPIVAVLALYNAVGHWNSYFSAMIYLQNEKYYPLQLILRQILLQGSALNRTMQTVRSASGGMENLESLNTLTKYCAIVVSTLPIIAVYPFLQKYFIKGVMIGAVKG
ncbi:MAG: carbohydrate ABC transporter permease, partial [Clostridia bacterium]